METMINVGSEFFLSIILYGVIISIIVACIFYQIGKIERMRKNKHILNLPHIPSPIIQQVANVKILQTQHTYNIEQETTVKWVKDRLAKEIVEELLRSRFIEFEKIQSPWEEYPQFIIYARLKVVEPIKKTNDE